MNNSSKNISVWFFNNKLNINIFSKKAEAVFSIVEQHFKIIMSDEDYSDIILILSIILSRYTDNCIITNYGTLNKNQSNVKLAHHILDLMLDKTQDVSNLDDESRYLSTYLTNKNLVTTNENIHFTPSVDYYIIVKSFLYKLSNSFSINLLDDYKLQEYLTSHIVAMINRLKNKEKLDNPYKNDLINTYKNEYKIIKNNLFILEETVKREINDDEITYIMMHIIAALERLKRDAVLPKVLVLCHAGFGTSHFLAENLKKHFKIDIIDVTSSHYIQTKIFKDKDSFTKQCDFIISTTPIIGSPVPWIQVSPILTPDDIFKIHNMISDISVCLPHKTQNADNSTTIKLSSVIEKEPNHTIHTSLKDKIRLSELLTENHILLDKSVSDWKEAIIKAGEPLLWSNSISVEYLMAMLNSALENGPYFVFVPGFALAHAAPEQGAKKLDISFLRLKEPVNFGHKENDPVSFVLSLSLADTKKNVEVILELMDVICSDHAFINFENAKNEIEIINIFKNFEQKN